MRLIKASAGNAPRRVRGGGRGSWRRRTLFALALFVLAWPLAAWVAARALVVSAQLPKADAIVVFGGASAYAERTRRAAELFRAGVAPKVVLTNDNLRSGWSSAEQRNPLFVERAAEELRRAGVPADRIETLSPTVSSTYEEVNLIRDYATTQRLGSVLFVTSGYHSRRALWTARRVFRGSGVEVGLAAVSPGEQTPGPFFWWWHRRGWRVVGLEYPKLIYYRLRYR
jgi:uncharacterized SAM-binding protein YcdF (DUF218 family)